MSSPLHCPAAELTELIIPLAENIQTFAQFNPIIDIIDTNVGILSLYSSMSPILQFVSFLYLSFFQYIVPIPEATKR